MLLSSAVIKNCYYCFFCEINNSIAGCLYNTRRLLFGHKHLVYIGSGDIRTFMTNRARTVINKPHPGCFDAPPSRLIPTSTCATRSPNHYTILSNKYRSILHSKEDRRMNSNALLQERITLVLRRVWIPCDAGQIFII